MGTFHHDRSPLHGITVAVDTRGAAIYIGRCEDMDDETIVLVDVDVHQDGADGRSKAAYLQRAAKFGTWKKHDRLALPMSQVAWVKPLGQVPVEE
jgi:hypothetical protein